jgi:Glycosyltransferase
MTISLLAPSTPVPVGGVILIYELANAFHRRGRSVNLVHVPWKGARISSLADLNWFNFEQGITHHLCSDEYRQEVPDAEFVFRLEQELPSRCGLPLILVQGLGVFGMDFEQKVLRAPCPKVCVSGWLIDVALERGVPPHQLLHIPPGIDHQKYGIRAALEGRPTRVAMLYNDFYMKGASFGLEVLQRARNEVPDLECVVFTSREPIHEIPSAMSLLIDPSQREIVEDVYNKSAVFVCSAERDGFGMTSVEAMACGCALVTTASGGSEEFAFHGNTALVCDYGDIDSMVGHLVRLLNEPDFRFGIARRGAAYVERFDWDHDATRIEDFLRDYKSRPEYYCATQT